MIITAKSVDLGIRAKLFETDINREASDYIIEHYDKLIEYIQTQKVVDKASDLLHDVYLAVKEDEDNGEGYDINYGFDDEQGSDGVRHIISVGQFVYGRIKLYCKNIKYSTEYIEKAKLKIKRREVIYEPSYDSEGNAKERKVTKLVKDAIIVTASAATANESNDSAIDNNDEFQMAYSMAMVADSTDDVTELLSLREEIDYCIDVGDLHSIKMLNMFKNMDALAATLEEANGKRKKQSKNGDSIFGAIREMVKNHSDFAESLLSILTYAETNRSAFDSIIATY